MLLLKDTAPSEEIAPLRLTTEMEVLDPNGQQAAAMIWSQSADVGSAAPRVSRIGDAYDFASSAASDFGALFQTSRAGGAVSSAVSAGLGRRDEACSAYGSERRVLSTALGLIGIGVSPELTDPGAPPSRRSPP